MPDRILRQYASIFFFAPLVRLRLDGHNFGLSEGDKTLIRHSVRRGYITFMLGVSFLVVSVMYLAFDRMILPYLYRVLMGATIISLGIGIRNIHHPNLENDDHSVIITNHMLLAFVPGYNWYLWYTEQDHHKPYRWLKESILWRYVIMVCLLFPGLGWVGITVFVAMIVRIIVLAAGYDVISPSAKQWLNKHYMHYVSERWAYVSAGIEKLRDQRPYTVLVQEHRGTYCRILPKDIHQRHIVDAVSYGICIVLLGLIIRGSRGLLWSVGSVPLLTRGLLLLVAYMGIRIYTMGLSPVPLISPLVQKLFAVFTEHKKTF